ncbi:hypothetical protein H0B56_18645 [Haloechinothrix sp. YIM 98757]|uniref:DUF2975 domain-containing protein n=1 Tax=Haloechinothrix aidingensis TaxID=2752311 RepID=A0A838AEL3_9PSEU|nr:hypothetical protein [Haloechinothrix aidingensis]MBA0127568.1 hypothetical protein [Haloechinothrix aidingensis]
MPAPQPATEKITRRCTWLGLGVVVPAPIGLVAAIVSRQVVVADGERLRVWLIYPASIPFMCAFVAGGVALAVRTWVQPGRVDVASVRSLRNVCTGACVIASLSAAVAIGLLAGMSPAIESGAAAVLYGAMILLGVALTVTCLVVQRPLLWRSPYCDPDSARHD